VEGMRRPAQRLSAPDCLVCAQCRSLSRRQPHAKSRHLSVLTRRRLALTILPNRKCRQKLCRWFTFRLRLTKIAVRGP
jgi:hypothetical protein